MSRARHVIVATIFLLCGVGAAVIGAYRGVELLSGPPAVDALDTADGALSIGDCSGGRGSIAIYSIATSRGPVTASIACRSPWHDALGRATGQPVSVRYAVERDFMFLPKVRVYELRVGDQVLWGYEQSVAPQVRHGGWLMAADVVLVLVGLFVVRLAWRALRQP